MKKISEGVYEDVKCSDILKIEMFYEDKDGFQIFSSNLGTISYWNYFNNSRLATEDGKTFFANGHSVIKHMIGLTVGEAIDWIKTKSN